MEAGPTPAGTGWSWLDAGQRLPGQQTTRCQRGYWGPGTGWREGILERLRTLHKEGGGRWYWQSLALLDPESVLAVVA